MHNQFFNPQSEIWFTKFIIPEEIPFSDELYSIKLILADLSIDNRFYDEADASTLRTNANKILAGSSEQAKLMFEEMLVAAIHYAQNKGNEYGYTNINYLYKCYLSSLTPGPFCN